MVSSHGSKWVISDYITGNFSIGTALLSKAPLRYVQYIIILRPVYCLYYTNLQLEQPLMNINDESPKFVGKYPEAEQFEPTHQLKYVGVKTVEALVGPKSEVRGTILT
jgi:hypothetical protein